MSVSFFNDTDEMVESEEGFRQKKHEINLTATNAIGIGRAIGWDFKNGGEEVQGYICNETQTEDFIERCEAALTHSHSFERRSSYIEYMLPRFIALAKHAKEQGEHIYYS